MSDPTAPDLPVLPPEPEGAKKKMGLGARPHPVAGAQAGGGVEGVGRGGGRGRGVVVVGGIDATRLNDLSAVDTTSTPGGQVDSFGGPGLGASGEITDIDGSTITLTLLDPRRGRGRERRAKRGHGRDRRGHHVHRGGGPATSATWTSVTRSW